MRRSTRSRTSLRSRVLASALAVLAGTAGVCGPGARAEADGCQLRRTATDPDTGYVYGFPIDNPTAPVTDPGACDADHAGAYPFVPVKQSDGSWVYPPPASVEPGFDAVPATITSCPAVITYAIRGAREDVDAGVDPASQKWWSRSGLAADHGAGVIANAVYQRLAAVEPPGTTALYADHYPADYLMTDSSYLDIPGQFLASVKLGIDQAVGDLNRLDAACPDSHLLVIGYSQGAYVLRRTLADARLAAGVGPNDLVEIFADVNFEPGDRNQPGSPGYDPARAAITLHGAFTPGHSGIANAAQPVIPLPAPIPRRFTVHSWCHDQDPACQGTPGPNFLDQHLTYGAQDSFAGAYTAAQYFATSGSPKVTPTAAVPSAHLLSHACVSLTPGTTRVQTVLNDSGSPAAATFDGGVGYTNGGTITPAPGSTSRTVAAGASDTWSQNLPFVFGQNRFLYSVTAHGVSNPDAVTPAGTHPDALLHEGFYDTLC
ncbi:cutinase family protein [Actinomadura rupiterrae]|uniref:cutinase family protein n=1 Tax=Actinomadura rupiterrae TaxID=559627 RepID=UPI0020A35057|nr:cutinase family protein [Actinomadura rupiterrae]MCP2342375.1 hypothetical protein [Actinomadura rupiterrae]